MTTSSNHNGDWNHVESESSDAARQPIPRIPPVIGPANSSAFAETAGKILDLKGLLRPPTFTGLEKDWSEWKFRVDNVWTILGIVQVKHWSQYVW